MDSVDQIHKEDLIAEQGTERGKIIGFETIEKRFRESAGVFFSEGQDEKAKWFRTEANKLHCELESLRYEYRKKWIKE